MLDLEDMFSKGASSGLILSFYFYLDFDIRYLIPVICVLGGLVASILAEKAQFLVINTLLTSGQVKIIDR